MIWWEEAKGVSAAYSVRSQSFSTEIRTKGKLKMVNAVTRSDCSWNTTTLFSFFFYYTQLRKATFAGFALHQTTNSNTRLHQPIKQDIGTQHHNPAGDAFNTNTNPHNLHSHHTVSMVCFFNTTTPHQLARFAFTEQGACGLVPECQHLFLYATQTTFTSTQLQLQLDTNHSNSSPLFHHISPK
jgi:hypothetical protein